MKRLGLVLIIALLGGCVTGAQINWRDINQITPLIKVERDDFKKITSYVGPKCSTPDCSDSMSDYIFLRAWRVDGDSLATYQIYVVNIASGWLFLDEAFDDAGNEIDVTQISSEVLSCSQYGCMNMEQVGLNVTKDYLEANRGTGVGFQVSGNGGKAQFFLPPKYISAFIEKLK